MSKQDRQGARTASDLVQRYNFGKTFGEVYGLVQEAQKAAEVAQQAVDELDATLTPEEVFNRLTNYGEDQGIYRENEKIYVNASYIKSGKIDSKYIDVENLKVDAANIQGLTVQAADIQGTLTANQIKLGGAMSVYKTATGSELGGFLGYIEGEDYEGNTTQGMGMLTTSGMVVATSGGAKMSTANGHVVVTDNINLKTNNDIWLTGTNIYSSVAISDVSDRNKKDSIQYDVDKYLPVFDGLNPATFYYKEHNCGKRHLGFIAQDVESAMESAGIKHEEFAPLDIRSDGSYGLRYTEFIPLLVAKIKQLEQRISELEGADKDA